MFTDTSKQPKLSHEQIDSIRKEYFIHKITLSKLADSYNVSKTLITDVVQARKRFADIPFPLGVTEDLRNNRKPANQSGKITKTSFRPTYATGDVLRRKAKKAEYNRRYKERKERDRHAASQVPRF